MCFTVHCIIALDPRPLLLVQLTFSYLGFCGGFPGAWLGVPNPGALCVSQYILPIKTVGIFATVLGIIEAPTVLGHRQNETSLLISNKLAVSKLLGVVAKSLEPAHYPHRLLR